MSDTTHATQIPMPSPTLHAGQRLATSGFTYSAVADYGNARAAERDTFWQIEIDRIKRMHGAELVEFHAGIDPVSITAGAAQPMIPDSWRFGFVQPDGGLLRFQRMDSGPLVAWEAVARFIAPPEADPSAYWHKRCQEAEGAPSRVRYAITLAQNEIARIDAERAQ